MALLTINGKGSKRRALFAVDKLFDPLMEYINPLKANDLLFPGKTKNKVMDDSTVNKRIAVRTIQDNFKKLTERTKICKRFAVTCHTLRHSCATELNEKGVKILIIQDILGHATPKTTINYYLHASDERIRDALERLPVVKYLNKLVNSGQIRFTFQNRYRNTG